MISGVTKNGFAFEITDERVDNMELIDALADIDSAQTVSEMIVEILAAKKETKN